jgi:hypothetical protein
VIKRGRLVSTWQRRCSPGAGDPMRCPAQPFEPSAPWRIEYPWPGCARQHIASLYPFSIPLDAGRLYDIVRARILAKFGRDMCLHDFRRAAATFLAMDAPEKIGLIPGVLQHASPDVGEHYNISRSMQAGRRFAAHLASTRNRLRPLATQSGIVRAGDRYPTAPNRDKNAR